MGKYDLTEIQEKIKDAKTWDDCEEKSMSMKALGSMMLSRLGQIEYKPGIYLEKDQLRLPGFWDGFFGCWLEYDDANVFDSARKIDLVTGRTESTYMQRSYGYDHCTYDLLDLEELLDFIRELGNTTEATE